MTPFRMSMVLTGMYSSEHIDPPLSCALTVERLLGILRHTGIGPGRYAHPLARRGGQPMIANPVPWPNGARCAVAFTFDMDADSILHLAHHTSADTRLAAMSMLRYGPEIAVPRLVELYKRFGMHQTFFLPAWCMERYPTAVGMRSPTMAIYTSIRTSCPPKRNSTGCSGVSTSSSP